MIIANYVLKYSKKASFLFFLLFSIQQLLTSCKNSLPDYTYSESKIKGLAYVAPRLPIDSSAIIDVKKVNAEWVAIMPYGFVKSESGEFIYSKNSTKEWQWWGEKIKGSAQTIQLAQKAGLKIMVKPHIWLGWGEFTGHMDLKNETAWNKFEEGYLDYLLTFAKLSDSLNVEIYCIATEMEKHVELRPEFWKNAIKQIKSVYKGKLTYAENWDSYQKFPFWNEMDFIGIDAYFPLSDKKSPSISELEKGWKPHIKAIKEFSNAKQQPILFTEIGYRSCDYSTQKPWETNMDLPENELEQKIAYEAFFKCVWKEPFFAGSFIWKWFPNYEGKNKHDKFTPQFKLAETELKKSYEKL